MVHAHREAGWQLRDAARPLGNRAGGVAGPLGAQRRQVLTEAGGLVGADRRPGGSSGGQEEDSNQFR